MKAASALLAFVAVGVVMVAMGDTETMMEGTTELLQEAPGLAPFSKVLLPPVAARTCDKWSFAEDPI